MMKFTDQLLTDIELQFIMHTDVHNAVQYCNILDLSFSIKLLINLFLQYRPLVNNGAKQNI